MAMKKKCKTPGCYEASSCYDGQCIKHTKATKRKKSYACRTYPKSAEAHLGVEVECFARDAVAYNGMLSQFTAPCDDASLPIFGCEFKICKPAKLAVYWAGRLVEHVKNVGGTVNRRCGLHVHLDARGVSHERIKKFCEWMGRCEGWWFKLIPESRRTSTYVQRTGGIFSTMHNSWVHATTYPTVEIRLHGGSLNVYKVSGWLVAMWDIMKLMRSNDELPEIILTADGKADPTWLKKVFPSVEGREYVVTRQNSNGTMETYEERAACAD